MKIYKIAQNFEIIPQDPNAQNNPDVQLQNLQNSQSAIQYFQAVTQASEALMANLRELEDTLGMGDIGMRAQFQDMIKGAAQNTPAFNLLAQMNLISSIDNLLDQNELNTVKNLIVTNISTISSQYTSSAPNNQLGGQ